MKIHQGFISNSSSTSFIITNLTDEEKTMVDFVTETPWIIIAYNQQYGIENDPHYSQGHLMVSAEENNITFAPNEEKICVFGDEQNTLIGAVYDYMLRGEDISESAKLMKKSELEKDPTKSKLIAAKWYAAMSAEQDLDCHEHSRKTLTGVDSPSFQVRFHEWNR